MSDDFSTYIQSEREELSNRREQLLRDRKLIDDSIAALDREFMAINAYERVKAGRAGPASARKSYTRRGVRREDILSVLRQMPAGASRGELLDHFGVKGDKSGEASVSNALYNLLRGGEIAREGKNYLVSEEQIAAAAE